MKMTSKSLIVIMYVLLASTVSNSLAAGEFVITTTTRLGFKEKAKSYVLGQPVADFLTKFGPAESCLTDDYSGSSAKLMTEAEYAAKTFLAYTKSYGYVNDGLIITEDKAGRIKGVIFYVRADHGFTPATVRTEQGVSHGASLREIVKVYGQPRKQRERDVSGYHQLDVFYRFGDDVLSFRFKDGVLSEIHLLAGYLPYLK
jgi:hypothetical protein